MIDFNKLLAKLEILSAAARYDASCASSGSRRSRADGVGGGPPAGVCHSWSADGRCISLLKVLYSNRCRYDCAYCVNRRSKDVPRVSFTPHEVAELTVNFYRRNYVEGLFLSNGVFSTPDETMEELVEAVRLLRYYGFAVSELLDEATPHLDVQFDPKAAWALRHPEIFPVEVNRADYEMLLRVPGVGVRSARRILRARRTGALHGDDLARLGVVMKRASWFLTAGGRYLGEKALSAAGTMRDSLLTGETRPAQQQLALFAGLPASVTGEL